MSFFIDQAARDKIATLENEINSIKSELLNVDNLQTEINEQLNEVSKRAPEHEIEAREAATKTKEISIEAQASLVELNLIKQKSIEFEKDILDIKNEFESNLEKLNEYQIESEKKKSDLIEKLDSLDQDITKTVDKINEFEEILDKHPDLEEEIENFEESILKIKDSESKSLQLVKSINTKVIELETLYDSILGYNETDDDGEERIIQGLKQELEQAYDSLYSKKQQLESEYQRIDSESKKSYEDFENDYRNRNELLIKNWDSQFIALNNKIEGLLPNALTAGLSHAFSQKKRDEIESHTNYKRLFLYAILGLVAVSLVPFIISIYSIIHDVSIEIVVSRIPKIVSAILPLYIPVLWFAISSSKKVNLSKRLIEEYTHKEVLSKTYEGLSRQLENLESDESAKELKTKLLQNFLLMYSENPGKLISDYNKTDHPIMELLENSNKLESTISKLENIPGLNKISKILESKSKRRIEKAVSNIENGIDKAIALNDNVDQNENES